MSLGGRGEGGWGGGGGGVLTGVRSGVFSPPAASRLPPAASRRLDTSMRTGRRRRCGREKRREKMRVYSIIVAVMSGFHIFFFSRTTNGGD